MSFSLQVPAAGKLILQLEFTSKPLPATPSSPSPSQTAIGPPSSPSLPAPPPAPAQAATHTPPPSSPQPAQTSPSSHPPLSSTASPPTQPGSFLPPYGMNVIIVEARDAVREFDQQPCDNPCVCVSLIRDPQLLEVCSLPSFDRHRYLMLQDCLPNLNPKS